MEKRIDPVTGEETMEPTTLKEVTESIIEMRRMLHQEALQRREEREAERRRMEEQQRQWEEERQQREKERLQRENERQQRENERQQREKERQLREEEDRQQREKERQQREEERKLREEEDQKRKEEDRKRKEEWKLEEKEHWREIDRKIDKFFGQFTTDWGRLLEEVTKPAAVKLFKEIGIDIDHIFQESRHREESRQEMEADVILVNTTAVVVVEVKTTLRKDDVDHFLKQMELFKDLFREFKDKTVYVAVAAIKFNNSSDVYARKKGVFVLRSNGEAIFGLDNIPETKRRKY